MGARAAIAIVLILASLAGCASLSERECRAGDWRGIGLRDGQQGYPVSRLDVHREACAPFGVAPDAAAYAQGRDEGIVRYCTAASGFAAGRVGEGYERTCSGDAEDAFLDAYRRGLEIYRVEQDLEQLEQHILRIENVMLAGNLGANQRVGYRYRLSWAYAERASLQRLIWRMEDAYRRGRAAPAYTGVWLPWIY